MSDDHYHKPYEPGDEHVSEKFWYEVLKKRFKTIWHPFGERGIDYLCLHSGRLFAVEIEQRKSHWESGPFPWARATIQSRRFKSTKKLHLPVIFISCCTDMSRAVLVDMPRQWEEPEYAERFTSNTGWKEHFIEADFTEFTSTRIPQTKIKGYVDDWYVDVREAKWEPNQA